MIKSDVEILIRSYCQINFELHPSAFSGNIISFIEITKGLAKGYWDHRNRKEIKRDEKANVTCLDYQEWVMKELFKLTRLELCN